MPSIEKLAADAADTPLWSRGLAEDPAAKLPRMGISIEIVHGCDVDSFQGEVYTDGSGLHGKWARLRRCGWAAIQLEP